MLYLQKDRQERLLWHPNAVKIDVRKLYLLTSSKNFLYLWIFDSPKNFSYWKRFIQKDRNSQKKRNLAVYEAIVFGLYLRNLLRYKKSFFYFLHQFLKSFQMKKEFVKSVHIFSWFCAIRWFFNKKSAIEKNPPFWKIKKYFYHYLHHFLKSFQMKKEFFEFGHKISWYLKKTWFCLKKVSYWKKSAILKS